MKWKIYIFVTPRMDRSPLYTSWVDHCPFECVFTEDEPLHWIPPDDAGLIVSHIQFYWDYTHKLWSIWVENKIPVLILADGVLDYKNTYDNPNIPAGTFYNPVFGHKIACIGWSQLRQIERWGNKGKCELVGLPRLDSWTFADHHASSASENSKTILVVSANTPFFTKEQEVLVRRSYQQLLDLSRIDIQIGGYDIKFKWRLRGELKDSLQPDVDTLAVGPLFDELSKADAVITAPSTVFIEAALLNLPTAILDYCNLPSYLSPAWRITVDTQIIDVLSELVDPPASKMQFQYDLLSDAYQREVPALTALYELMTTLISCRNKSFVQGEPLRIPQRILPLDWKDRISDDYEIMRNLEDQGDSFARYEEAIIHILSIH